MIAVGLGSQAPYKDRERTIAKRYATRLGQPLEDVLAHLRAGRAWCVGCTAWRLACEFYADESRSTGRRASCKACHVADVVERRSAIKDDERRVCASCFADKPIVAFGRDRSRKDGLSRACRTCNTLRVKQNTERREAAREARTNAIRTGQGSGGRRCSVGECPCAGTFVLKDGTRACARHLKARVKERKSEQRSNA